VAKSFTILKVILVFIFFLAGPCFGARLGKIKSVEVDLYESPSQSSKSLSHLRAGQFVAASNLPTRGFFKVRSASGVVGWITGDAIEFNFRTSSMSIEEKDLERELQE
jgi:hypothetical protein